MTASGYGPSPEHALTLEIILSGKRYFLSRPRRFGKSLTLSTLDAMFQGKAELFKGLAAEGWVAEQARRVGGGWVGASIENSG